MTITRDQVKITFKAKHLNIKVKIVNNRFEIYVENKYVGFFVVNEEKCSTDFTFNDDFKCNEDFARLIIDEYLKDSK